MIIFFSEGRLGNQLFQYAFLKSHAKKNEKIIIFGFNEIKNFLENIDVIHIPRVRFTTKLYSLIKKIFFFLARLKLINYIELKRDSSKLNREGNLKSLFYKVGIFSFITFVKTGFFESEQFFKLDIVKSFKIKDEYTKKADLFLENVPSSYEKIFVHIRRGDLKEFKIGGKDTMLPLSYFQKQIDWFTKNKKNIFFIFLSDDTKFIEKNFKNIKNKIISKNSSYVDMTIMTKCQSAILSASSFSWWGAYLMTEKKDIFCPKYFIGFNSKIEYPCDIVCDFFKEVEV